jgi:hypothetical protein
LSPCGSGDGETRVSHPRPNSWVSTCQIWPLTPKCQIKRHGKGRERIFPPSFIKEQSTKIADIYSAQNNVLIYIQSHAETSHEGLVPFQKKKSQSFLSFCPPKMLTVRRPICASLEEGLNKTRIFSYLDLRLVASRTVRNKCLLFLPLSLWYFVIA